MNKTVEDVIKDIHEIEVVVGIISRKTQLSDKDIHVATKALNEYIDVIKSWSIADE